MSDVKLERLLRLENRFIKKLTRVQKQITEHEKKLTKKKVAELAN